MNASPCCGANLKSSGALAVRALEEELIDFPANPVLGNRLLAPANPA